MGSAWEELAGGKRKLFLETMKRRGSWQLRGLGKGCAGARRVGRFDFIFLKVGCMTLFF
jgi:hypothetical protein